MSDEDLQLSRRLQTVYAHCDTLPPLIEDDSVRVQSLENFYIRLNTVARQQQQQRQNRRSTTSAASSTFSVQSSSPIDPEELFRVADDVSSSATLDADFFSRNHSSFFGDEEDEGGATADAKPEVQGSKVLITGGPGMGKTTLLHYLAYRWGRSQADMWGGKFLFVVRLRLKMLASPDTEIGSKKLSSIDPEDAVVLLVAEALNLQVVELRRRHGKEFLKQHKIERFSDDDVRRMLQMGEFDVGEVDGAAPDSSTLGAEVVGRGRRRPRGASQRSDVLLLLDGFDEIAPLCAPASKHLAREVLLEIFDVFPNLLLSSRPMAVQKPFIDAITLQVENIGLGVEGVHAFVDAYLRDDAESRASLLDYMHKNPAVQDLCSVPINAALLCLVWGRSLRQRAQSNTALTLAELYYEVISWLARRHELNLGATTAAPATDVLMNGVAMRCVRRLAFVAQSGFEVLLNSQLASRVLSEEPFASNIATRSIESVHAIGLTRVDDRSDGPTTDGGNTSSACFSFVHLTFQEFLAAYYIAEQIAAAAGESEGTVLAAEGRRMVEFIALRRYMPALRNVIKFLVGIACCGATALVAGLDAGRGEFLKRCVWECLCCNVNGALEIGVTGKIDLVIDALSQSRGEGDDLGSVTVPQEERRHPSWTVLRDVGVRFVDEVAASRFSLWGTKLCTSGYMSQRIASRVAEILAFHAPGGTCFAASTDDDFLFACKTVVPFCESTQLRSAAAELAASEWGASLGQLLPPVVKLWDFIDKLLWCIAFGTAESRRKRDAAARALCQRLSSRWSSLSAPATTAVPPNERNELMTHQVLPILSQTWHHVKQSAQHRATSCFAIDDVFQACRQVHAARRRQTATPVWSPLTVFLEAYKASVESALSDVDWQFPQATTPWSFLSTVAVQVGRFCRALREEPDLPSFSALTSVSTMLLRACDSLLRAFLIRDGDHKATAVPTNTAALLRSLVKKIARLPGSKIPVLSATMFKSLAAMTSETHLPDVSGQWEHVLQVLARVVIDQLGVQCRRDGDYAALNTFFDSVAAAYEATSATPAHSYDVARGICASVLDAAVWTALSEFALPFPLAADTRADSSAYVISQWTVGFQQRCGASASVAHRDVLTAMLSCFRRVVVATRAAEEPHRAASAAPAVLGALVLLGEYTDPGPFAGDALALLLDWAASDAPRDELSARCVVVLRDVLRRLPSRQCESYRRIVAFASPSVLASWLAARPTRSGVTSSSIATRLAITGYVAVIVGAAYPPNWREEILALSPDGEQRMLVLSMLNKWLTERSSASLRAAPSSVKEEHWPSLSILSNSRGCAELTAFEPLFIDCSTDSLSRRTAACLNLLLGILLPTSSSPEGDGERVSATVLKALSLLTPAAVRSEETLARCVIHVRSRVACAVQSFVADSMNALDEAAASPQGADIDGYLLPDNTSRRIVQFATQFFLMSSAILCRQKDSSLSYRLSALCAGAFDIFTDKAANTSSWSWLLGEAARHGLTGSLQTAMRRLVAAAEPGGEVSKRVGDTADAIVVQDDSVGARCPALVALNMYLDAEESDASVVAFAADASYGAAAVEGLDKGAAVSIVVPPVEDDVDDDMERAPAHNGECSTFVDCITERDAEKVARWVRLWLMATDDSATSSSVWDAAVASEALLRCENDPLALLACTSSLVTRSGQLVEWVRGALVGGDAATAAACCTWLARVLEALSSSTAEFAATGFSVFFPLLEAWEAVCDARGVEGALPCWLLLSKVVHKGLLHVDAACTPASGMEPPVWPTSAHIAWLMKYGVRGMDVCRRLEIVKCRKALTSAMLLRGDVDGEAETAFLLSSAKAGLSFDVRRKPTYACIAMDGREYPLSGGYDALEHITQLLLPHTTDSQGRSYQAYKALFVNATGLLPVADVDRISVRSIIPGLVVRNLADSASTFSSLSLFGMANTGTVLPNHAWVVSYMYLPQHHRMNGAPVDRASGAPVVLMQRRSAFGHLMVRVVDGHAFSWAPQSTLVFHHELEPSDAQIAQSREEPLARTRVVLFRKLFSDVAPDLPAGSNAAEDVLLSWPTTKETVFVQSFLLPDSYGGGLARLKSALCRSTARSHAKRDLVPLSGSSEHCVSLWDRVLEVTAGAMSDDCSPATPLTVTSLLAPTVGTLLHERYRDALRDHRLAGMERRVGHVEGQQQALQATLSKMQNDLAYIFTALPNPETLARRDELDHDLALIRAGRVGTGAGGSKYPLALYNELRRNLHAMFTASMSISSGFVANEKKSLMGSAGSMLSAVGVAIPLVGSVVSAVGAVIAAADNVLESERLKRICALAVNDEEFGVVAEKLSREIVLRLGVDHNGIQMSLSALERVLHATEAWMKEMICSHLEIANSLPSLEHAQAAQDAMILSSFLVSFLSGPEAHRDEWSALDVQSRAQHIGSAAVQFLKDEMLRSPSDAKTTATRATSKAVGGEPHAKECCHQ